MAAIADPNSPGSKPKGSKKLLVVAMMLGLIAAALNWLYLSSLESSTITVLKVKGQPILAGTPATKQMFEPIKISGNLKQLQSLVVAESEFPAFDQKLLGETMQPGQLLLLRSFELTGENPVRDSIRPGERALSVNVPHEADSVAYFVRPGDSVDIWGKISGVAFRLKERACVKAVGESHISPEASKNSKNGVFYNTVTLVVSDSDVQSLIQNVALAGDGVTLSLVGPCDANAQNIPALAPMSDPKATPTPARPNAQPAPAPIKGAPPATAPGAGHP